VSTSIDVSLWQVAASLVLVALAAAISYWQRADLERDIAVATIRRSSSSPSSATRSS
jgi:ABC-type iron transport system FetAB permease component